MGGDPAVTEKALAALPDALKVRETDVVAQVVRSGKPRQFQPASQAVGAARIREAIQGLHEQYGDDVQVLAELNSPTVDKTKACDMLIALYSRLLSAPPNQSGPILRLALKR
jgi:hypothetical protein